MNSRKLLTTSSVPNSTRPNEYSTASHSLAGDACEHFSHVFTHVKRSHGIVMFVEVNAKPRDCSCLKRWVCIISNCCNNTFKWLKHAITGSFGRKLFVFAVWVMKENQFGSVIPFHLKHASHFLQFNRDFVGVLMCPHQINYMCYWLSEIFLGITAMYKAKNSKMCTSGHSGL